MKKYLLISVILLFSITSIKAQDCFKYFPDKKGTTIEYTNYDKKDVVTSTVKRTVVDKRSENSQEIVDIKMETVPADKDTVIIQNFSIICKDGKIYMNLASLIDQSAMGANAQGMEVEIKGNDVNIPNNPVVGQMLDSGQVIINFLKEGDIVTTVVSDIINRKVEAFEDITTPAGTFHTFKISYDVLVTVGFLKIKSQVAEWYTEKYGMIKSESYNKKGKLESYMLLSKISN